MRRIKALLLLAGLLLTMTACSREVQPRYFDHVNDAGFHTYACVRGNSFSVGYFDESEAFEGSCTLQEDGSYMLDFFTIPVKLRPYFGDFFVIEFPDAPDMTEWLAQKSLLTLHDDGTFTIYNQEMLTYTVTETRGKTIVRVHMADYDSEYWVEGATVTDYDVARGTYAIRERGATRMVDLIFGDNTLSATLTGDTLTVTFEWGPVRMEKIGENEFFALTDGKETIMRLLGDGTAEYLAAQGRTTGHATVVPGDRMECVAGEMRVIMDVEGDKIVLTINDNDDIILSEVE